MKHDGIDNAQPPEWAKDCDDFFNHAPCGFHSLDDHGVVLRINDTELRWLGYTREECEGKLNFLDFLTGSSQETFRRNFPVFKSRGWLHSLELELLRKDGSTFPALISATAVYGSDGIFRRSRSVVFDLTGRKEAEREHSFLAAIVSASDDAIIGKTMEGIIVSWNPGAERLYGYSGVEIIGRSITTLAPPDRVDEIPDILMTISHGGRVDHFETVRVRKDGSAVDVSLSISSITDAAGKIIGASSIARDISSRKRMDAAIKLNAAVFASTSEGIIITDEKGIIRSVNQAFETITGYTASDAVGRNPRFLKSGRHDITEYRHLWATLLNEGQWRGELWNKRKNGEIYPQETVINAIRDEQGRLAHFVSIFSDITIRKQAEELLRRLSVTDGLTGLTNRRALDETLDREWRRAMRAHAPLSFLMLDIDYFKKFNDSYGHPQGDECLKRVANVLLNIIHRPGDLAARLGGEEFAVVLPNANTHDALKVAETIRATVEGLNIPHEKSEAAGRVTVSIGIASLIPRQNSAAAELIAQADKALYLAKLNGRNRVEISPMES